MGAGAGAAWAQPGVAPIRAGGEEATVIADQLQQVGGSTDLLIAIGNVEIIRGQTRLLADRVELNRDTGQAVAQGKVAFYDGADRLVGERIDYSLKIGTGVVHKGSAVSAPYDHLSVERMDRVGDSVYEMRRGVFTTGEDADPPRWFRFSEGTARSGSSASGSRWHPGGLPSAAPQADPGGRPVHGHACCGRPPDLPRSAPGQPAHLAAVRRERGGHRIRFARPATGGVGGGGGEPHLPRLHDRRQRQRRGLPARHRAPREAHRDPRVGPEGLSQVRPGLQHLLGDRSRLRAAGRHRHGDENELRISINLPGLGQLGTSARSGF